jgi:hydrogenase maturation protease
MTGRPRVLLIGYGNPGRRDDGLGPALAEAVERLGVPGVTVDSDYQLTVEDAAAVAEHDVVIFADADTSGPEPYSFRRIEPRSAMSFTSHSVQPAALMGLARDLFGARTEGYLLGIRGYAFNTFEESLSDRARANLEAARAFIHRVLIEGSLSEAADSDGSALVVPAASAPEERP